MGKSRHTQRTKGNQQPSSSSKAAELLASAGSKSTSVFNFATFLKADNDDGDVSMMFSDSDFSYVLKKLSKRDSNTKAKGLQEFSQLCLDKDTDIVVSVLPYWVPVYTKLSLDNDRKVRELSQECLGRLLGRVKKQLAPHLKSIMAVWLMSQCDVHAPASATLAKKVFQEAFSDTKQSEAVWFCKEDVFNYLKENLFKMTIESIKESSICDNEEVEGRYIRLLTSSIDALARFFKLVDSKLKAELSDKITSLLVNPKFWKFPKNHSPSVRRAFFDLVSVLCVKDFHESISAHHEQIVHSVLYSLDESDPYVVPALWKAAVSVVLNVEDCWLHVNMRKGFLPKLFSVMDKGGSGCALVAHPNIIIILDKLPQEVKMGDGFFPLFLSKLQAGLENSQVQMSPRDIDAITCSFVECCKYFIFSFIEKSQLPNIQAASLVVREQLLVTFKKVIVHSKRILADSKFFQLFAELVWYFRKMSLKMTVTKMENVSTETKSVGEISNSNLASDKVDTGAKTSHSLWKHVFKTCLDELCLLLTSLLEEESTTDTSYTDKITKFLNAFFYILVDLPSPLTNECGFDSRKLKKKVSFDVPAIDSFSKKTSSDHQLKEMQKIYREDEIFRDFIDALSSLVFKMIHMSSPHSKHIPLFKMLFVTFACKQFIGVFKSSPSHSESECHSSKESATSDQETPECDFVKDVMCPWMISIDISMLSDVIEMFLTAIDVLSEKNKSLQMDFALQQLEQNKTGHSDSRTSKFLLLALRSKNSSHMLIRGIRCQELLVRSILGSVNWFIEEGRTSDDVWSLICGILLESMEKDGSAMVEVRNMILTSLQDHLIIFLSQNQVNRAFEFVQMLFFHLSQEKSLTIVSESNTLDWFFGLLLFASVRALTDISVDVCDRSRSVLVVVLKFLILKFTENGVRSIDEFGCFQKIRVFFMKYVWCYAESFKCLTESVETSIKILEIVRKHFRDFDILEDFCNFSKVNFSENESCESLLKDPILMKKSLFDLDGKSNGEQLSIKHQISHWIFTAKLLGCFTASQNDALRVARSCENSDHDSCETYDVMSQQNQENLTIDRVPFKRESIVHHVVNMCSCLAHISLCSDVFDETCSIELASDLNLLLDEFMKHYADFEIAKLCILHSIQSCLTDEKAIEYKVQSCYRLKDDDDTESEKKSLVLFNLLSKISKYEYFSDLRDDEEVANMMIKVEDVKKEIILVALRILVHFSFHKLSKRLFRDLKLQVAGYELTCHDGTAMIVNSWPQLNLWTALDIILSKVEFDDFFSKNKDTIDDETHQDAGHERDSCMQLVPVESAADNVACSLEKSELAESLDQLLKKTIELKDFYANLKRDLKFSDLNGLHVEVLSFFKNFVMRFGKMPNLAIEHWDAIICYLVSQLEVFSENFPVPHESFSRNFSSVQPFLKAVSKLAIQLCKFFSSQDIPEEFCQLVDEWSNLFCPSIFEHMCHIFISAIKEQKLHETEFDELATLICEVITYCPSTCMSSLLSKNPSSSSPSHSDGEKDEAESLFELLSPLLSFPSRYVQVTAHVLLKRVVPMKIEFLKSKYTEDFSALLETQQQQPQDDNNDATPASTYLPTLINSFSKASETLMNNTTFSLKSFDNIAISPSNYSVLLSYMLNFDLILETYATAQTSVKSALLHWFKSCVVERHLSVLLCILQRTPSVSLQQTAHESLTMPVITGGNSTVSCKEVLSSIDCAYSSNNVLLSKKLFKQYKIQDGAELESCIGELKEVAFRLYVRTVHAFPRIVRSWFSGLDQKASIFVDKFTSKYISPGFISKELASVQCTTSLDQLGANLQVKTRPILKEITALYLLDDVAIELSINFPENSPLTSLKISLDHNKITSVRQNCSSWLLQLVKILNYKDGSLLDALSLWRKNLDRHFDGNSCMICFSLILNHQGSKILPQLQCKTCKKKFHSVCLYTWFKTSHNAACPLCRSVF